MFYHHHHHFLGLFGLPFLVLHFLPTIIAVLRHSRSTLGIFLLNFFLSWTVIGWFAALIWAITSAPRWGYGYGPAYYPPGPYRRW